MCICAFNWNRVLCARIRWQTQEEDGKKQQLKNWFGVSGIPREASTHRSPIASLPASAHISVSLSFAWIKVNAHDFDVRRATTVNEVTNAKVPLELTCHLNLFNSLFSFMFGVPSLMPCMRKQAQFIVHYAYRVNVSDARQHHREEKIYIIFLNFVKFCSGAAADTHFRRHCHVMEIQKNRNSRNSILNELVRFCIHNCLRVLWRIGSRETNTDSADAMKRKTNIPLIWWFWLRKRALWPWTEN